MDEENQRYCSTHGIKIVDGKCYRCNEQFGYDNALHNALYADKCLEINKNGEWKKYFTSTTPYMKYLCHHCKYHISHQHNYCHTCGGAISKEKISAADLIIKYADYKRGP